MKILYILFVGILLVSCKENTSNNTKKTIEKTVPDSNGIAPAKIAQQHDSLTWIQRFREFRDAVYQNNKTKVKSFMDFPIMSENNEIWVLVFQGNEKKINQMTDEIKPFTEQDFDKYFDKLFSRRFINSILKLKSEEFNKKDEIETVVMKDGNATTYKMYATVNNVEKTLTLNLSSNTIIKDKKGEVQDGGESNVIYIFTLPENGQLKFHQIRLAG